LFSEVRLVLLRVSRSGALIELQQFQPASALCADASTYTPTPSVVSVLVADLASHIERMRQKDLHPSSEIFSVHLSTQGSCNAIFYDDPDGNRLEFVQVTHPVRRG
jgi:hypothetical protein